LAGALAWISEDVRFDLDQIRGIRNEFAHNADHELSFADQSISAKCSNLRVAKVLIEAHEHAASTPHPNFSADLIRALGTIFHSPRQRFELTVEMLAQHLDELPEYQSEYGGPNLQDELWTIGSRIDIKTSATAIVGSNGPDVDPK
jgi:hypothetical protein